MTKQKERRQGEEAEVERNQGGEEDSERGREDEESCLDMRRKESESSEGETASTNERGAETLRATMKDYTSTSPFMTVRADPASATKPASLSHRTASTPCRGPPWSDLNGVESVQPP